MELYDLLGSEYAVGQIPEQVFIDINFDLLLEKFLSREQVSNILAVLSRPLSAVGIKKRQELFLELEKQEVRAYLASLSTLVQELEYKYNAYYQQENSIYQSTACLALAETYITFVETAADQELYDSVRADILRGFITRYTEVQQSADFIAMQQAAEKIRSGLKSIGTIGVKIKTPDGVPQLAYLNPEPDTHAAAKLQQIAEKFETARKLRQAYSERKLSDELLDGLSQLYPELFAELEQFHRQYQTVIDPEIFTYRKQIAFYHDLHSLFAVLREHQIPLCMAQISQQKQVSVTDAYDLTLLLKIESGIVPNDIKFSEAAGFYLLTGANSGGKTAYLRTVAISFILFSAGAYIPAVKGEMYPFQQIFTHFPADESRINVGRLQEERNQIEAILNQINADSLVLLNETFSSTNEEMSVEMCRDLIAKLCEMGVYGLFITHHHRLLEQVKTIQAGTKISSLTAVVLDDEENTRTYKIVAEDTGSKSYAQSILERYGLTRPQLIERLREVVQC